MVWRVYRFVLSRSREILGRYLFVFSVLGILCAPVQAAPSAHSAQLIQQALQQEKKYRQTVSWELQDLFRRLPKTFSADFKERCLLRLRRDIENAKALRKYLNKYKADYPDALAKNQLSWPLANNKMIRVLEGAYDILENDFDQFLKGTYVKKYLNDLETTAVMDFLDDKVTEFNGNSYGTYIKAALGVMFVEANNSIGCVDPDSSYIFHKVPFPKGFDPKQVSENFESFSFYIPAADDKSRAFFVFPHSGYAYGGVRDQKHPKYIEDPLSCPQDCSSWVGDLLGIGYLSTYHLSFFHRQKRLGLEPSKQMSKTDKAILGLYAQKLEPVVLERIDQIQPGDLYVHRVLEEKGDDYKGVVSGTGGHAGLVTSVNPHDNTVTIIGVNRLMPHIEGYGFFKYPVFDLPKNRLLLFFRVKEGA